jgi:electron transfer flavoprotein alpha subunit
MSNIGVLIETGDDGVKESNFGVITAARGSDDPEIHAFVLDGSAEACKGVLASYGVEKVVALGADGGDLSSSPDLQAAALAAAVGHFNLTALLGLSSAVGRDLLARAAAMLDAPLVQDCLGVDLGAQTVTKSHFSGKTVATIKLNGNPIVCGLRPNSIEPHRAPCEGSVIEYQAPLQDGGKLKIQETKQSASGAVDLTEAYCANARRYWERRWELRGRRWMRALRRTACKWARPVKRLVPNCTSAAGCRVRCSILRG